MNGESIDHGFEFAPFRLLPMQRLLLEGEKPVRVGSRALEILMVLVANAGRTIGKAQLMASVWPHNVVEEAALRVHMAALRKALGDGLPGRRYITTVPQRGYAFVASVRRDPLIHLSACPCGASPVWDFNRASAARASLPRLEFQRLLEAGTAGTRGGG
jgi:DNA-binding winged helix-turn-helix (wHTH) protein